MQEDSASLAYLNFKSWNRTSCVMPRAR